METENIDYVVCKMCGVKKSVIAKHISRQHKISTAEYRQRFNAATHCEKALKNIAAPQLGREVSQNQREQARKFWKEHNPMFREDVKQRVILKLTGRHFVMSDVAKKHISEALKGKSVSASHRLHLSQALKGRHLSEQQKLHLSEIRRGVKLSSETRYRMSQKKLSPAHLAALQAGRKPWTQERRQKNSQLHKGKIISLRQRQLQSDRLRGIKLSPEHVEKIRQSLKGKKKSAAHKLLISENMKRIMRYRVLPLRDTKIEKKLQTFLSISKLDFVCHKYINIKHGYQCDIFVPKYNLVIECDGDYWHRWPYGNEIDHIRTKELCDAGYIVIRLWERDIHSMTFGQFNNLLAQTTQT